MPAQIDDETPSLAEQATTQPINRLSDKLTSGVLDKFKSLMAEVPGIEDLRAQAGDPAATPPANGQPAAPPASGAPATPPAPVAAQPAAAPAPAVDPSIPESDLPPAAASAATKENWHRFRLLKDSQIKAAKDELELVKKELDAAKKAATGVPVTEFETLKQAHQKAEAELERVALSRSERFRNHYDGGIAKAVKLARQAAGKHADEVEKLLREPGEESDKRLAELKAELGIRGDIISKAAATVMELTMEREEQLNNHAENVKLLRAREATEAAEARQQDEARRSALATSILARAQALPEFKPAPGDTAHATFAASALDFIRDAVAGKLKPDDVMLLPVAAMKAQFYESIELPKLKAEVASLTARVAQLTGASPRVDGQPHARGDAPAGKTALTAATYDPQKAAKEVGERFARLMAGESV